MELEDLNFDLLSRIQSQYQRFPLGSNIVFTIKKIDITYSIASPHCTHNPGHAHCKSGMPAYCFGLFIQVFLISYLKSCFI